MRKIISVIICLAFFVLAASGCSEKKDSQAFEYTPSKYELTYSSEHRYFTPGDEIQLTVTAKNVGADPAPSSDLFRSAQLIKGNRADGTTTSISSSEYLCGNENCGAQSFEVGDSISRTYVFKTSETDKQGFYAFCVDFCGECFEFICAVCLCTITDEEKAIIDNATSTLLSAYPHLDVNDFRIKLLPAKEDTEDEKGFAVEFVLLLCGYKTSEVYRVFSDGSIEVKDEGTYLRYVDLATEPLMRDATLRLKAELSSCETHSRFFLRCDKENYLCICAEILDFDPNLFDMFDEEKAYLDDLRLARVCRAERE